jgi:hypothetical protein
MLSLLLYVILSGFGLIEAQHSRVLLLHEPLKDAFCHHRVDPIDIPAPYVDAAPILELLIDRPIASSVNR